MCFSVNVNLVREELEERFGIPFPDKDKYQPSYYYHAFSLPRLPAVCAGESEKITLLRWGLIPSWTRSRTEAEEIRFKTFNARAETASSKPSFASAFRNGRCLIPVRGFFEWQHTAGAKIPWYIYHSTEQVFSLAGLWDRWTDSSTGEIFSTFSIITTEANDLMAEIHNSKKRMPVVLGRNEEQIWISPESSEEEAGSVLRPCRSELLKAHTISNLINNRNADRNTPEVIKPFIRQTGTLF